ncbi:SGNH/GDSL hydrolase family protein [Bifidobacterium sp. 82T10]|uniref:SGNH/GDSL hydrolase family protein n=1 Tax=Bifidobacterium miconis TaxID=2834435 RepID=A0ABS6WI93_9BIFI|nr:SGNH/GDSL hydrolase family protein [Bifidobacterium miconis]MBW3092931.1 SGNH/GDSL hydrolase family protein [Bifidobacterium miconis]
MADEIGEGAFKGKLMFSFGDSICHGHYYPKFTFPKRVAELEGMDYVCHAVNGSTIIDFTEPDSPYHDTTHHILRQVKNAAADHVDPDVIIFDGGVNDAVHNDIDIVEFGRMFRMTAELIRKRWPNALTVYVTVHRLWKRDWDVQVAVYGEAVRICGELGIPVANMFEDSPMDTRDPEVGKTLSFDEVDADGEPIVAGNGTHPCPAAVERYYVPLVRETLHNPTAHIPAVR